MEQEFSIKLIKTKIEEINFKEPDEFFINDFVENNLKIKMTLKFACKKDSENLTVILVIEYDYEIEENVVERRLLNYNASFEFQITNLHNIIKQIGDKLDVPTQLLAIVAGVAIGTTRGIIFAKTAGSFVNQFYIPIVNPEEIVKQITPVVE